MATKTSRDEMKEVVREALSELPALPRCVIEDAKLSRIENAVEKLTIIILGNGHPEEGMLYKLNALEDKKKELDPGQKFLNYITDKVLPSLITTGILALIAFEWALSQHLVLSKVITP